MGLLEFFISFLYVYLSSPSFVLRLKREHKLETVNYPRNLMTITDI
jgi:hypothetical protein